MPRKSMAGKEAFRMVRRLSQLHSFGFILVYCAVRLMLFSQKNGLCSL